KLRLRRRLRRWYQRNGRMLPWRDASAGAYEQVVSEVLLQRTRAETVAAILPAFLERYPSWEVLAGAEEEELEQFLVPIGLWRRRARSLLALARKLASEGFVFPSEEQELLGWPAIGPYVAAAVQIFVHDKPAALIDEGVARLLGRAYECRTRADIRADKALRGLAGEICGGRDSRGLHGGGLDAVAERGRARGPPGNGRPFAVDSLDTRKGEEKGNGGARRRGWVHL